MPAASAPNGETWLELTTPHFRMRTNVYEPVARETISYFEETRAAMLSAAWDAKQGPPGRTEVILFARKSQFAPYTQGYALGETQGEYGYSRQIVYSQDEHVGLPSIAAHELAHELADWYMPLQPRWLAEGLATFLETVRIDRAAKRAFIGMPPEERFKNLLQTSVRGRLMGRSVDTAALLRSNKSPAPGAINDYYAQAWLLLHYFIFEQSSQFANFQHRIGNLDDWRVAYDSVFESAFEPGPRLDSLLQKHLEDRAQWDAGMVELPVEAVAPGVRSLTESDVHGLAARLCGRRNPERAAAEVTRALALDPGNLDALEVGFYLTPDPSSENARGLAARAISRHPEAPIAWAMAVDAGLKPNDEATLRQALSLEPLAPRVLERLARAELREHHYEAAYVHAAIALRRSGPFDPLTELYFASAQASGHCDQAWAIAHNSFLADEQRDRFERQLQTAEPHCAPANTH